MNSLQNQEFKVGYKKAYSDLSQAAAEGVAFGEFPYRTLWLDPGATREEWNILKSKFGVQKVCENNNLYDCWVNADRICVGCAGGNGVPFLSCRGFVDLSGRAWASYTDEENIFLVDTNGDKEPNRFGKDRWVFTFAGENGKRICSNKIDSTTCSDSGIPKGVIPFINYDITTKNLWCQHPPCRYKSWLYN